MANTDLRPIKFRGYNKKRGEWLYGSYILNRGAHFVAPDEFAEGRTWEDYEVEEESIGQFTGLTDKKYKEIYEGDILKWYEIGHSDHDVLEPPEDYIRECMDVVEFKGGTFCVGREGAPSLIPIEFLTEKWQANDDDMFKWVYNTDEYPNITIDDMYICEVVGNIHDDPDLIVKGGNDGN